MRRFPTDPTEAAELAEQLDREAPLRKRPADKRYRRPFDKARRPDIGAFSHGDTPDGDYR